MRMQTVIRSAAIRTLLACLTLCTLGGLGLASSAAAAQVGVFHYFEGLPADYQPDPSEGWQGVLYFAQYFEADTDASISTLRNRQGADGTRYVCVGWKNGSGDIPSSGDGWSTGSVTLSSTSSVTWIYREAYEVSVDIAPFDQRLWSWGYNGSGQLGIPSPGITDSDYDLGTPTTTTISYIPTPVAGNHTEWVTVSAGTHHTVAVRKDGTLWGFGANAAGETTGSGGLIYPVIDTPTRIGTNSDWVAAAAGHQFTLALKSDGSLWSWGSDAAGKLGQGGGDSNVATPTRVGTDADWVAISAGTNHALAIKRDGTLWAWGENNYGRLGAVDNSSDINIQAPLQVGDATDWAAVAAGAAHTLALKTDGSLWGWGLNNFGQVGVPPTTVEPSWSDGVWEPLQVVAGSTWKAIANGAGSSSSLAIRADGTLWAWGNNGRGQLGLGDVTPRLSPTQVGTDSDWATVSIGSKASAATKEDGSVWVWGGDGDNLDLSLGAGQTRTSPTQWHHQKYGWLAVAVGSDHMVGLRSHAHPAEPEPASWRLGWAWGDNGSGQLGLGTPAENLCPFPQEMSGDHPNWRSLSAGEVHTVAIQQDGTLWAWGDNAGGVLGLGLPESAEVTEPTQLGSDADWAAAAAGFSFTLGLKTDGTLWVWGRNDDGQLGDPTLDPALIQNVPRQVGTAADWAVIAAGHSHALAIKQDGTLWAWGIDIYGGELGLGDVGPYVAEPTQVGTDTDWSAVSAGWNHSLGLKTNGDLYGWGYNANGEVGNNIGPGNDFPNEFVPVPVGTGPYVFIEAGGRSSFAIDADGKLWAWGLNDQGQLGVGDTAIRYAPTQVGTRADWVAVSSNMTWFYGEIRVSHTAGVTASGALLGWGSNESGVLGLGFGGSYNTPTPLTTPGNGWIAAEAGGTHTVTLRATAPTHYARFEARPHLASRLLPVGETVSTSVKVTPLQRGAPAYLLGAWQGGYGDLNETGGSMGVAFDLTQETGLDWVYAPLTGAVSSLSVATAGGPAGLANAIGYQPELGEWNFAQGAPVTLSAPPSVTIAIPPDADAPTEVAGVEVDPEPTYEEYVCVGWQGTGSVPATGAECSVAVTLDQAASTITWNYALATNDEATLTVDMPVDVPAMASGDSLWEEAAAQFAQQEGDAGQWSAPVALTQSDHVVDQLVPNTTVQLTTAYSLATVDGDYRCTGLLVTQDYSENNPLTIVKNKNGERMEFVLTIPAAPTTNIQGGEDPVPLEMAVQFVYKMAELAPLGQPLALSLAAGESWENKVTDFVKGHPAAEKSQSFYYDEAAGQLYPVQPVSFFQLNGTAYYADWPTDSDVVGIVQGSPAQLEPSASSYAFQGVQYSESYEYGAWVLNQNVFQPPDPGKTLLLFTDGNGAPEFMVVETVAFAAPATTVAWEIGSPITDPSHDDTDGTNGYVYNETARYDGAETEADRGSRAYVRESRVGPILPVNRDDPADPGDDMVVVWYAKGATGAAASIAWPVAVKKYDCRWPDGADTLVVASGRGSGPLPEYQATGTVYLQPDPTLAGYNPNEEHALLLGGSLFALQNRLNTYRLADGSWVGPRAAEQMATSEPYVLLKYVDPDTAEWAMEVYQVVAEESSVDLDGDGALRTFTYDVDAGSPISPPAPLSLLPLAEESDVFSGAQWHHKDHKGGHWAKAACSDSDPACTSEIVIHWHYPLQGGFYCPDSTRATGDSVPLLGTYQGDTWTPAVDATYATAWSTAAPSLPIGETLTEAKYGLPEISAMASAKIIFDENLNNGGGPLATIFDPFTARAASLERVPTNVSTESIGGKLFFPDLPQAIAGRLHYDPLAEELRFQGISVDYGIGEPLLLVNIMTERERVRIRALGDPDGKWLTAVDALFAETRAPSGAAPVGVPLALSAGMARGEGYLVLAENDDPQLGAAPVQLHIIRVGGGPYQGDIKVIDSDNPFDEKLTLRHSGDFGGQVEDVYFRWFYKPDVNGLAPKFPAADPASEGWIALTGETFEGYGVNDITIEGAGLLTLSDNWFIARYYYGDNPDTGAYDATYPALAVAHPDSGPDNPDYNWSPWAGAPGGESAQLAQGWIKRVVSKLNPLDARVTDFRNNETSTEVSMISQLGERREGDIALNGAPDNLNNIGLIEAYGTVLDRGIDFSIEAAPPADYGPANVALLNAATRIASFYTLLGHEAYADTQDPTIAWDSQTGEQGAMASSLFAFTNQLGSLLEEELVLLRGRDDSLSTTRARPVYNRLIWNFTNGDGEIAYVQTYNISDMDTSGVIDELDAKVMYPQGHGDAWGHYLTAMTTWYQLLRHPSYTWEPRIESVLVGGAPVPVDYLDERKFAETAASRARAGAEIVDLTYRKNYVADTAGQWQGYKDTDTERAWGVDDWARRAGQGAYFDWVVANAMLPSEDPNPDHAGIQKIDRSTVAALSDIPSQYHAIQWQLDEADAGLNPLGLAEDVVPFDIDPTFLEVGSGIQGVLHFDQIYERAVTALQNALDAFDFANQYTLLTRGNEDELAAFRVDILAQERDYTNRLIEIYGYPYSGDIGAGGAYPEGYDGPDLLHFMYMDTPELDGLDTLDQETVVHTASFAWEDKGYFAPFTGLATLTTSQEPLTVEYPMVSDALWTFDVPASWGERRAPGELQTALSELISANAAYRQGLVELDGILAQIESAKDLLQARYDVSEEQLMVTDISNSAILALHEVQVVLDALASMLEIFGDFAYDMADAAAEGIPDTETEVGAKAGFVTTLGAIMGLKIEPTDPPKAVVKIIGSQGKMMFAHIANALGLVNGTLGVAAEFGEMYRDRVIFADDARFEVQQMAEELNTMHYEAEAKILELCTLAQAMQQAAGAFRASVAEGERLLNERETFRKLVAGDIQEYRYQDFAFRTFRNDAVQKYRATFDLAARYAYLAATAYDYETNMLDTDASSGQEFLAEIVRRRSPGMLGDGGPVAGDSGLSDLLARLSQNFSVYKTQLGINNPQIEDNRFSLRRELFRIRGAAESDPVWRSELRTARIADLWQYPPFRRYCRPFAPENGEAQPGLVIPFSTEVTFGHNLFGWPLGAGDSALDPTHFTTKLFGVGVTFSGYENAGLSNTPRIFLVPAGADVLRVPTDEDFVTRQWRVVDQKLPVPFPISETEFNDPTLIPIHDLVSGEFGGIRRQSSFRAYFDGGDAFNALDETLDLRLVGRSVWNTQWLLIIPGGTLLEDPAAGLEAFIDAVDDIQLTFSTYAFSGN